jgi:hypothetical protein
MIFDKIWFAKKEKKLFKLFLYAFFIFAVRY